MGKEQWPELSYEDAKETYKTIHLWTQIVGKIKIARLPWINHSWHVTLFLIPTGLTTGDIPSEEKHFQINFDFVKHILQIATSKGETETFDLESLSVASCYENIFTTLKNLDISCEINPVPNEMEEAIPFPLNKEQSAYNPQHAHDLHRAMVKVNKVFTEHRAGFVGKCSPVHFFWGSFDMAVSRFSGKKAPLHPGGIPNLPDWVAQEAYSHEVCSFGFWPGSEALPEAAFYSYIYPEPELYPTASIKPETAYYHKTLREYILPYKDVQRSENPRKALLDFLDTTYGAAATLANWNRNELEYKLWKTRS